MKSTSSICRDCILCIENETVKAMLSVTSIKDTRQESYLKSRFSMRGNSNFSTSFRATRRVIAVQYGVQLMPKHLRRHLPFAFAFCVCISRLPITNTTKILILESFVRIDEFLTITTNDFSTSTCHFVIKVGCLISRVR